MTYTIPTCFIPKFGPRRRLVIPTQTETISDARDVGSELLAFCSDLIKSTALEDKLTDVLPGPFPCAKPHVKCDLLHSGLAITLEYKGDFPTLYELYALATHFSHRRACLPIYALERMDGKDNYVTWIPMLGVGAVRR